MFEIRGDRPQWQMVYDRLASMQIGDVVKYDELAALLPDAGEGSWRSAFHRAVREVEDAHKRTFGNVRGVGYRMVAAAEHEGLARTHHKRARRQLGKSVRKVHAADRSLLTREERARMDAIELNLAQQVELTKRLEAKLKAEVRERKTADAELSDKVDQLAALLAKHGITAEASV